LHGIQLAIQWLSQPWGNNIKATAGLRRTLEHSLTTTNTTSTTKRRDRGMERIGQVIEAESLTRKHTYDPTKHNFGLQIQ
jgi:hypothetical protein